MAASDTSVRIQMPICLHYQFDVFPPDAIDAIRAMPERYADFKTVRHSHTAGECHELTFSCFQRRPLLVDETWRRYLADQTNRSIATCGFRLIAFVIMPEHAHILVYPDNPSHANISRLLKAIKQPYSSRIKRLLLESGNDLFRTLIVRERPGKETFRFWQEGPGYDRNLTTSKSVLASLDYIHMNPVKRGLCNRAIDWKWSSARYYECGPDQHDVDLPNIHSLPAEFLL